MEKFRNFIENYLWLVMLVLFVIVYGCYQGFTVTTFLILTVLGVSSMTFITVTEGFNYLTKCFSDIEDRNLTAPTKNDLYNFYYVVNLAKELNKNKLPDALQSNALIDIYSKICDRYINFNACKLLDKYKEEHPKMNLEDLYICLNKLYAQGELDDKD